MVPDIVDLRVFAIGVLAADLGKPRFPGGHREGGKAEVVERDASLRGTRPAACLYSAPIVTFFRPSMSLVRTFRLLLLLGLAVVVARAETPTWAELEVVYGEAIDSAPVRALIARYRLRKFATGNSGSFGASDHSYTLSYNANQIDCIALQVGPWPTGIGERSWRTYTGDLPFGLTADDDRERVIERLGRPLLSGSAHFQYKEYRLVLSFRESGRGIGDVYIWKDVKP